MKNINQKAPVKCNNTITINETSENVWAILTDINNWADWQTEISKSKLNGVLKHNSTFDWKTGGTKIHSTLHTVEPFKYFGWTGKALGTFAIHNWTLKEVDGQTEVLVEESMEGFIPKFFKKALRRNVEKGMRIWLNLLKKQCE